MVWCPEGDYLEVKTWLFDKRLVNSARAAAESIYGTRAEFTGRLSNSHVLISLSHDQKHHK